MQTLELYAGDHINSAIKKAVALRDKTSEPVRFEFNELEIVCRPGDTEGDLRAQYNQKCEKSREEYAVKRAAYLASPEGQEEQAQARAAQELREQQRSAAFALAPEAMSFKDEAGWKEGLRNNTDPYGRACFDYASAWARLMEGQLSQGRTVTGCAKEMSHLADTQGITGFMYGCAVGILSACWAHGEELRRWHNLYTQIRDEGEKANEAGGVLNPAVLTMETTQP